MIRDKSIQALEVALLGLNLDPPDVHRIALEALAASPTLATDLDFATAWRMAQEECERLGLLLLGVYWNRFNEVWSSAASEVDPYGTRVEAHGPTPTEALVAILDAPEVRAALAAASPEPERLPGGMKRDHEGRLMPGWGDPEPAPAAPTVEALTVGTMTDDQYQEAFGEPAAPTVEALRDALLDDIEMWYPGEAIFDGGLRKALDAIIAAARADERTRLAGITHHEGDGCEAHP